MKAAARYVGVREGIGSWDNPLVVAWLARVVRSKEPLHDETAWCSAFVNGVLEESGVAGTGKANARSWLQWGKPIDVPRFGCVTVLWRTRKDSANGHVAFFVADFGSSILLLGGNQKNAVRFDLYPKLRLLGHRWPL